MRSTPYRAYRQALLSAILLAGCTDDVVTEPEQHAIFGIVSELPAGELDIPYEEEEPAPELPSEEPDSPTGGADAGSGAPGAPDDWRPDVVGNADTPVVCPIGWRPNALAPVFYGYRDYDVAQGAPAAVRVYFPSLEGSPSSAKMLENCGRYPVVLFAHGQCTGETNHHQRWQLPAQLARSGYIVVVPALPLSSAPSPTHPALTVMESTLAWLNQSWELRSHIMPNSLPGVVGHSYGGVLGAEFARTRPVSGFVAVGADWHSWSGTWPVFGIAKPKLLIWGGQETYSQLAPAQYDALSSPKHRAVFTSGAHWDYLPAALSICHPDAGSCTIIPSATSDLVIMFFAKYLPPELAPELPSRVPADLYPPTVTLTPEQQFFAGGHLTGMRAMGSGACGYTLTAPTPPPAPLRTVPDVRDLGSSSARTRVLNAGLQAQFYGTGTWVYSQSPQAGAQVPANSMVTLTLRSGPRP